MTTMGWQRLKLVALIAIFVMPMALAWGMVEFRIGIPDNRTAHGALDADVPPLSRWPALERTDIASRDRGGEVAAHAWTLAYDCGDSCAEDADRWWRLHRALGKDAHRLSRVRVGGDAAALPGESLMTWTESPEWASQGQAWLLDPQGWVAVAYPAGVETRAVMDDIEHLFKRNPEPPLAALGEDPGEAEATQGATELVSLHDSQGASEDARQEVRHE